MCASGIWLFQSLHFLPFIPIFVCLSPSCRPHWKSSATWPPEDAAGQPLVLHLTAPPAPSTATASSPGSIGSGTPAAGAQDAEDPTTAGRSRPRIGRIARDVRACKDGRLEADAAATAASASMAVDTSRFLKVIHHHSFSHAHAVSLLLTHDATTAWRASMLAFRVDGTTIRT